MLKCNYEIYDVCPDSALCSKKVVKVWHVQKTLHDGISQIKAALIHVSARAGSPKATTLDEYVGFCLSLLKLPAAPSMSFSISWFSLKSDLGFYDVSKVHVSLSAVKNCDGQQRCVVSSSFLKITSKLENCCVEFCPFLIKICRHPHCFSLSAVRLSSLGAYIDAQMYQNTLFDDVLVKNP